MARKSTTTTRRKALKIKLWLLAVTLLLIWGAWIWGTSPQRLATSTLKTSFSRLSSAEVLFTIPNPGKLVIKAGPTPFLSDATLFALTLFTDKATPKNPAPFTIDPSYSTVFNMTNPSNPQELILAFIFPKDRFKTSENVLGELPFAVTAIGQFEVKSIFFGSMPSLLFPGFQDYPIFIESSNILFDEKGAARVISITPTPAATAKPACSDGLDNDGDGKIDFSNKPETTDPGCTDANDNDETDPKIEPIRLDIPAQFIKTFQTLDLKTEILVILPPAQEQLRYEFMMKAKGGKGEPLRFGVRGRLPNVNKAYPFENSGLVLSEGGLVSGDPANLKGGNYRYPLFVTDGKETLNFGLQMAVNDALGNTVALQIETSFSGTEHRCRVNQPCKANFKATKGIEPYTYSFSGETPVKGQFLQVSAGEAFYSFVPTTEQVGSFNLTVTVFDSSTRVQPAPGPAPVGPARPAAGPAAPTPPTPPSVATPPAPSVPTPPAPAPAPAPTPTPTPAPAPAPAAVPSTPPTPTTVTINIKNISFGDPITIKVGDTVKWVNLDQAPHTVTSADKDGKPLSGPLNSGGLTDLMTTGEPYSFTFTQAGTFNYICEVHRSMLGKVIVTAAASAEAPIASILTTPGPPSSTVPLPTIRNSASVNFTLIIERPIVPIAETTFKFAPERTCEFLDLSSVDIAFDFFQFTCRNGIMEGFQGSIRAFDFLNRAEAAKVTSLIVGDPNQVEANFSLFASFPPGTTVNYNDVTVGDWYASFVYYLFKQGVIVDNIVYRPADKLNAAEAMKLVIEGYASLNEELLNDLEDIRDFTEWYHPYQTVASYVDATIATVDPSQQAERVLIAELLFKLAQAYPTQKFQ